MKPGDSTLQLLGTLTPLIRAAGPERTTPEELNKLPKQAAAAAVWALYVGRWVVKDVRGSKQEGREEVRVRGRCITTLHVGGADRGNRGLEAYGLAE